MMTPTRPGPGRRMVSALVIYVAQP
jgi:hypothetical protein